MIIFLHFAISGVRFFLFVVSFLHQRQRNIIIVVVVVICINTATAQLYSDSISLYSYTVTTIQHQHIQAIQLYSMSDSDSISCNAIISYTAIIAILQIFTMQNADAERCEDMQIKSSAEHAAK